MGRENRFKNLQTRLNEQTDLCKLETERFKIILTCFTPLSRRLQITHALKLATMFLNIMLPMEVHIHKYSPH